MTAARARRSAAAAWAAYTKACQQFPVTGMMQWNGEGMAGKLATAFAIGRGLDRAYVLFIRPVGGLAVEGSKDRARLLFVLLTPQGQPRVHQRLQARIAALIENSDYVGERLLDAGTAAEVIDTIRTGEDAALD